MNPSCMEYKSFDILYHPKVYDRLFRFPSPNRLGTTEIIGPLPWLQSVTKQTKQVADKNAYGIESNLAWHISTIVVGSHRGFLSVLL